MDFEKYPVLALPAEGESFCSWSSATRLLLGFDEKSWLEIIGSDIREPERPARGITWTGVPAKIGSISEVPAAFRSLPEYRRRHCAICFIDQLGNRRWPTMCTWIDVRSIACSKHMLLLQPAMPSSPDYVHRTLEADDEIYDVFMWLEEWKSLERSRNIADRVEAHWRRDLTTACTRNWSNYHDHGLGTLILWELHSQGWSIGIGGGRNPPNRPARSGHLTSSVRLGAFIAAYRLWLIFRASGSTLEYARVPDPGRRAWGWLHARWRRRAFPERNAQLRAFCMLSR